MIQYLPHDRPKAKPLSTPSRTTVNGTAQTQNAPLTAKLTAKLNLFKAKHPELMLTTSKYSECLFVHQSQTGTTGLLAMIGCFITTMRRLTFQALKLERGFLACGLLTIALT